jgi:hypothetical protein
VNGPIKPKVRLFRFVRNKTGKRKIKARSETCKERLSVCIQPCMQAYYVLNRLQIKSSSSTIVRTTWIVDRNEISCIYQKDQERVSGKSFLSEHCKLLFSWFFLHKNRHNCLRQSTKVFMYELCSYGGNYS